MLALRLCVSVLARPQPFLQPYLCQLVGAPPALLWPLAASAAFGTLTMLLRALCCGAWLMCSRPCAERSTGVSLIVPAVFDVQRPLRHGLKKRCSARALPGKLSEPPKSPPPKRTPSHAAGPRPDGPLPPRRSCRFGWSPTGGQWKRLRDRCRSYTLRHPQRCHSLRFTPWWSRRWHRQHPTRRHLASRRLDIWPQARRSFYSLGEASRGERPLHRTHRRANAKRLSCARRAQSPANPPASHEAGKCWQDAAPHPKKFPAVCATSPRRSRRLDTGRHTCLAVPSPHRLTLCGAGMCATASACSTAFYHSPLPSCQARVSQVGPSAGNCRSSFSSYPTYKCRET